MSAVLPYLGVVAPAAVVVTAWVPSQHVVVAVGVCVWRVQVLRIAQLVHLDFTPGTARFVEVQKDMTAMLQYVDAVSVSTHLQFSHC